MYFPVIVEYNDQCVELQRDGVGIYPQSDGVKCIVEILLNDRVADRVRPYDVCRGGEGVVIDRHVLVRANEGGGELRGRSEVGTCPPPCTSIHHQWLLRYWRACIGVGYWVCACVSTVCVRE